MKKYPAIALLEISNIAAGLKTGDGMLKKSPIAMLKSGTVSRGKFLILVGGSVASVDEAYQEGLRISGSECLDALYLPNVHSRILTAALGEEKSVKAEALGTVETPSIASNLEAADAAIKGSKVDILEMRLGDNYGGKAYTIFNGRIEDVEAALEIAQETLKSKNVAATVSLIPLLHEDMAQQLNGSLRFNASDQIHLADGETDVTG